MIANQKPYRGYDADDDNINSDFKTDINNKVNNHQNCDFEDQGQSPS